MSQIVVFYSKWAKKSGPNEQVYFKILKGQENKFTSINKDGYYHVF